MEFYSLNLRPLRTAFSVTAILAFALFCVSAAASAKTVDTAREAEQVIAESILQGRALAAESIDKLRLSDADIKLYRKIFAAQRRGDGKSVERLQNELSDKSLLDWARMRRDAANIWLPQNIGATPRVYYSSMPRDPKQLRMARDVATSVAVLLKTDELDRAHDMVRRASAAGTIDRIETAKLWAQIAAAKLYTGDSARALSLAHLALQISGTTVPEAAWIAGLASWMQKDYPRAAQYFAWPVRSPYAGAWLRSASAFWSARALMRDGQYQQVSSWLSEAARHPRSFYGLIATRALGAKFDFNWSVPQFSTAHRATLAKYPGAVRALKLAQIGQMDMARLELTLLDEKAAPEWREALASLAVAALKPDAAMQVASLLERPGGSVDMALYPLAPWQPKDGYRLDPALINAFIRQESRFKPAAINSNSGATGLLQILPRTARAVDKSAKKDELKNPETSLMLGQKYLEELLDMTGGDLFEAAIAYNAGPGNLNGWKERFANIDDPLLFIELIPYRETRGYVERVMANYWIYSLRMGIGVASLDAVAAGGPARYAQAANRDSTQIVMGAAQTGVSNP